MQTEDIESKLSIREGQLNYCKEKGESYYSYNIEDFEFNLTEDYELI